MMKKTIILSATLLCCMAISGLNVYGQTTVQADSLLKLTEITENNKQLPVAASYRVVEPNSKLIVSFDKAALNRLLAGNVLSPAVTNRLDLLAKMLQQQASALHNLQTAISLYNQNKPDSAWMQPLQNIYPYVALILKDKQARAIYSSLNDDNTLLTEYANLFTTAKQLIPLILQQVQSDAKTQGVYLQLGAWLDAGASSTPIHIPGFDSYTPQVPSTVQRFQVVLTPQQQADLMTISQMADSANENGLSAIVRQAAASAGQGIAEKLKTLPSYQQLTVLLDTLKSLGTQDQAQLGALKTTLNNTYTNVQAYLDEMNDLIKKYAAPPASGDANQLLIQVNSDIGQLIADTKTFETTLASDIAAINSQVNGAAASLQSQVSTVATRLGALKTAVEGDVSNLKNAGALFRQLILGEDVVNLSHDFSDKVKQLSPDALPATSTINLTTAGTRDQGNKLVIKVGMGKAGQATQDVYERDFSLYFCSIYARTATAFLFVNPTPIFKRSGNNALFRYAPSYSILLKGFWLSPEKARQSIAYHSFFNPGLGLNLSSLDFKGDGSMALGVGGVFSIFNDFLQLGYGVNTFDGRGYAFFGFRLPVGSFSIR